MGATGYIIKEHGGSLAPQKDVEVTPADGTIDVERVESGDVVNFRIKTTYDGYEIINCGSGYASGYFKAIHVKLNDENRRYRLVCILNGGSYTPVAEDFAIYYIKFGWRTGGANADHWYIQEYSRRGNGSFVALEQIALNEYNILIHTPSSWSYANIGILKEDKEDNVTIEHFNGASTAYTPTGTIITTDTPAWKNGALVETNTEDLITKNGLLQLNDRTSINGLGYVILRTDKTFAEQVTLTNCIYEVRYNFNLAGGTVTIPSNCTLKFEGGKIENGTIICNNCALDGVLLNIFNNVTFSSFFSAPITPGMFGAIGDGVADDVSALRECVKVSTETNTPILIKKGQKYFVSGAINYYNGGYADVSISIAGELPQKKSYYNINEWGGIKVHTGSSLFENGEISGEIKNLLFNGDRDDNTLFFKNCHLKGLVMEGCTVSEFGAFLFDTPISKLCYINSNKFLTVYYFSKRLNTNAGIVDCTICNNYINGGVEKRDNSCFQFSSYNGSEIYGNFIDYYRIIFDVNALSSQTGGNINTYGNQYQVFKYLYVKGDNVQRFSFNSQNDYVNWTKDGSVAHLEEYTPLKYTGRDNVEYDLPNYIGRSYQTCVININWITIERQVGNLIFFDGGMGSYNTSCFNFYAVDYLRADKQVVLKEGGTKSVYNGGSYKFNHINTNVVLEVDTLPEISTGWSEVPYGAKVVYSGTVYTATRVVENGTEIALWLDDLGRQKSELYNASTTSNRPVLTLGDAGFIYFDTDLGKPIFWTGSKWVDATGNDLQ